MSSKIGIDLKPHTSFNQKVDIMDHPMKKSNPEASRSDPICGMLVSEETPYTAERDGETWYFCSDSGRQLIDGCLCRQASW